MALFSFLQSGKPNILKEMGFVYDQDGIIERYAREKSAWDIHLANSKQTILEAVERYKPSTIAILGSGWLLDVPIDELSSLCSAVYLYDIVHPPQIKHKVSKYSNVHTIDADITGGAIRKTWDAFQLWKTKGIEIDLISIQENCFNPVVQPDMVVSLNILNQLDILICDFLLDQTTLLDENVHSLRVAIQQKHIEYLQKQAFCLISDVEEIVVDLDTLQESTRSLVLTSLPQTDYNKEWQWQFDSNGNYYEGKRVCFNVKAMY